ncbi:stage II sporulation protein M [Clostridium formicaceticum]|uniref:Stage II sporulation protein M n=1 Tax=Clostridium formicaceticum TaxID=1497 RepID=A0AAC9RLN1_9CLOT|nr:stage II sporulation protein M [Clostridium formicaceticum]AOY77086.1 stage II sporulation protein M [Clostridium formicaceticum]ARE87595.1 Stage II sporulation protein M [Clostridium formicaceticum]
MFNKVMNYLKKHIRENLLIYSMVILCFLIGVSVGAFTVKIVDKHQKEELFYYLRDFFQLFYTNELSGVSIFRQSFVNNFQLLILSWILGLVVLLAPLVLLIVSFKGFVIGFTVALLIEEFKLWGILVFLLGVFPQNFIIIPSFIFAAVFSLCFSSSFIKIKIKKIKNIGFLKQMLPYSSLYGILVMIIVVASFIEAYIAPLFIRLIASNLL